MGVFTRPDSPWWWLYLENAPPGQRKEKTAIRIGLTAADRRDSRKLVEQVYAKRVTEYAARIHRLPTAQQTIRFTVYAERYARDVISQRKGEGRELAALERLKDGFATKWLHEIDADYVRGWMAIRRKSVSARTVNREVDLLKTMLRDAVPKYLEASPIAGLRRLPMLTPKRRLMTPEEERRILLVALDPQDRAIIILGLDALVRLGDLIDLKRTDRHGQWIYIADPKSGTAYEAPLSPRASEALDAIPQEDDAHYFTKFRRAENARDWTSSVRQRLERLCRDADIPYGRKKGGITFHWATRRTGATRLLVKQRKAVPVVQKIGNWKKADVLLGIYTEADRHDLLEAVGAIPSPIGNEPGTATSESASSTAISDVREKSGPQAAPLKIAK